MNATNVVSLEPKTQHVRLERLRNEIDYCLIDLGARIDKLSNEAAVLRLVAELLQKRQKAVEKLLNDDTSVSGVNVHVFLGDDAAVSHFTAEGRIALKVARDDVYDQEPFILRLLVPFVHEGILPSVINVQFCGRYDTGKLRCAGYKVSTLVI